PTSDLADGDPGKGMPFRFLDVDAKVDLVRGVAHLVLQNDLSFLFRRVVRLEQAWGHVRRARTSDADDPGILIGNGPHIGWVHSRLRVVSSQPAIAGCGGRSHCGHLGWLTTGIVGRHGEPGDVIRTRRERDRAGLEVAPDTLPHRESTSVNTRVL